MDIGVLADYLVVMPIGFCLGLGYVIKKIDFIPNKFIPLLMAVVGITVNLWVNNWIVLPETVLGGMISGLASTGLYELFRNFIEGTNRINKENK